jgi:hypothetical protein
MDIRIKSKRREEVHALSKLPENIISFPADLARELLWRANPSSHRFRRAELCAFPIGEVRQLLVHAER